MSFRFDNGIYSIVGLSGEILPGTLLGWYEAGTSTPLATFSDPELATPNTNPVVVSADGRLPAIWLQEKSYKLVVTLPDGTSLTRDLISAQGSGFSGGFVTLNETRVVSLPASLSMISVSGRTAASERVPMIYRRVSAQPPHEASFRSIDRFLPDGTINPTNGGWWELCTSHVTPEMLADRPCGYRVGIDGFATAPDDTDILNAAIKAAIHLDLPLELHGKIYRHNGPLLAEPTRATPFSGVNTDPLDINYWAVINAQSFVMQGYGNAAVVAGAAMDHQLRIYNSFTIPNSREPQWCKIDGVKFDGRGYPTESNVYLNWSGNAHVTNCGVSGSKDGILVYGFGVFLIQHNDLQGTNSAVNVQRGGDATICDNDIFVRANGIIASGNFKVKSNIFTGTGFKAGDSTRIAVIVNPVGGDFPYSYGMRVTENEFYAIDVGVYGDASAAGFRAIHMLTVADNQFIGEPQQPDMTLADITNGRDLTINNNQINRDVQWISQRPAIRLTDCDNSHISHNGASNIADSAFVLTRCKDITVTKNTLCNVSVQANAIAYSGALQSAPWAATSATVVTGTTTSIPVNTLLVPNGATLQRLQDNTTSGNHSVTQARTVIAGQSYTYTFLAKIAELSKGKFCPYSNSAGVAFDLAAGTITPDTGHTGTIRSLGNGVSLITATISAMPGTSANPGVYLANTSGSISYAGTGQGMFVGAVSQAVGMSAPSYMGDTGPMGSVQPAQIILVDSDHCDVCGNHSSVKYNFTFPNTFCAETGTSNNNTVSGNIGPDPTVMLPFFRVSQSSYLTPWERPAFRAIKSSTQSVPTTVSTKVTFDQMPLNRGSKFADGRFTPGVGSITLSGCLRVTGLTAGQPFEVTIMKNGNIGVGGSGRPALATEDSLSFSALDEAAPGDFYELYLYATGAGSKTITSDGRFSFFSGAAS